MVNELKTVLFDFWKNGSFFLINKFLLFQYSERIYCVSTRALALKVVQNDHVVTAFLTPIKLTVKSPETLGNKRMNIETIENGYWAKNSHSLFNTHKIDRQIPRDASE